MNYFYVGNHIENVGLNDIFAGAQIKANKLTVKSDLHIFSSAENFGPYDDGFLHIYPLPEENMPHTDRYLGIELDLSLNYAFSKSASFAVGYSQMLADETMERLKGGDFKQISNWAYVMFTFTPQFIK